MDPRAARRTRRADRQAIASARAAAGRDAPWRRRWRMARRWLGERLLRRCGPWLLRGLAATWRVERLGAAGQALAAGAAPAILVLWHGRLLAPLPLPPHPRRQSAVLVSPSDDGGLVVGLLAAFGYRPIRGSASRGGAAALRELAAALQAGRHVVLTPDGPRGPRHSVNSGPAWLAHATGAPLVGVGIAVDRAWRLRSWDRFVVPKPFARLVVAYTEPLAGGADLEATGARLREQLLAAERAGFARLGAPADHDP